MFSRGIYTRGSMKRAGGGGSQEGSILIATSVFLLVGLVLLGSIQIGYMYYVKRELQKTADMAALTGAQSLWQGCDDAGKAAQAAAGRNFGGAGVSYSYSCSVWSQDGRTTPDTDNALQIVATAPVSPIMPFFNDGGTISAEAKAVNSPIAAFSVGSRLLSVNSDGLLAAILKSAGLDPSQLNVLDSDGLATVNIRPSGLLKALGLPISVVTGIGTPEELTELANLTLGQLLSATATVVSQSQASAADIDAVNNVIHLIAGLPALDRPIKLLGDGGLLVLPDGVDPEAALNAQINALDIVAASTVVANKDNSINLSVVLPDSSVLQSGNAIVTAKVVNPPSLVVGGVRVQATSSQLQLDLELNTDKLPLVGTLLGSLATLQLGISVEGANSEGQLQAICSPDHNQAVIDVWASSANITLTTSVKALLLNLSARTTVQLLPSDHQREQLTSGEERTVNVRQANVLGGQLAKGLGSVLAPILEPVFEQVVFPLLSQLGIDLNQTDVTLYSVRCASPHLVQ